jgi:hypothetical protein
MRERQRERKKETERFIDQGVEECWSKREAERFIDQGAGASRSPI